MDGAMIDAHYYSSIDELSSRIRAKKISPVAIVDACLKRVEELNPKLNAFITILPDQAHEQAKTAEAQIHAGHWRGPLHGVPVGIKDFYDTAGIKTTAAFKPLKDRVPTKDAVSVTKLRDAGAIILGKMNMHELGMGTTSLVSHYGPVHNPWKLGYIAGGSSGGSAAAIASGLCYATLDTDAIGSCRLPAACCGVVGFKGTYGLISGQGILEGEQVDETIKWLAHPGITTRSVDDTAIVLNSLALQNAHPNAVDFRAVLDTGRKFRIGVVRNGKATSEVMTAFENALAALRGLGHPMRDAIAPFDNGRFDVRHIAADRKTVIKEFFTDLDALVLPTTTTTTPTTKAATGEPQALSADHTFFANYYGLPAISVPCEFDAAGLPLGLQIVGKPWGDDVVLCIAHQYQQSSPCRTRHPDL
jgi:aspartyl-tRNA(Asn)/glutamyl-tRNA(Gln) amidotransferase subunit A